MWCGLPVLRGLLVGSAVWSRWVEVDHARGVAVVRGPLAMFMDLGVSVQLATNPEWPPRAIVGVDDSGRYVALVTADGRFAGGGIDGEGEGGAG